MLTSGSVTTLLTYRRGNRNQIRSVSQGGKELKYTVGFLNRLALGKCPLQQIPGE